MFRGQHLLLQPIRDHEDILRLIAAFPRLQQGSGIASAEEKRRGQALNQLTEEAKRLNTLLDHPHFSLANHYEASATISDNTPRIMIRERTTSPPEKKAQERFNEFLINNFSGNYIALIKKIKVKTNAGQSVETPAWIFYQANEPNIIENFNHLFSTPLKEHIKLAKTEKFTANNERKRLGDTLVSVIGSEVPKIPVTLPEELGNMYDLIELLKLPPNSEGKRKSPCTNALFTL